MTAQSTSGRPIGGPERERARLVPPQIFAATGRPSLPIEALAAKTITSRWIDRARVNSVGPGKADPYPGVRTALTAELTGHMLRSLVLELALASHVGALEGTPNEQFRSFFGEQSLDPLIDYLSVKYPALATLISRRTATACRYSHTISVLWERDRDHIRSLLMADDAAVSVADVEPLGDVHEGGMRSSRIYLSNGQSLAFKPSAAHPQEFLAQFASRAIPVWAHEIQFPGTVSVDDHQWQRWEAPQEHVSGRTASTYGRWLAIAHLTATTDLHYENFVNGTDGVMSVDLETVASAQLHNATSTIDHRDELSRTLILPFRIGGVDNIPGPNWGAWGGDHRSITGLPRFVLEGDETPQIKLRQVVIDTDDRDPVDVGDVSTTLAESHEFREAFAETLRAARDNAESLRAFCRSQKGLTSRVILRSTQNYYESIAIATHPVELLSEERFQAALKSNLTTTPELDALVPTEVASLAAGEIPRFHTTFDQVDLHGVALDSAEGIIQRRLRTLVSGGDKVLRLLDQDIEAHVVAYSFLGTIPPRPESEGKERPEGVTHLAALSAAIDSGAASIISSAWPGEVVSWANVSPTTSGLWMRERSLPNLYAGLPGIYSALCGLPNAEVGALARSLLALSARPPAELDNVGAFAGHSGIAYALGRAVIAEDVALEDGVRGLLRVSEALVEALPRDTFFDIIGGAAGAIAVYAELVRSDLITVEQGAVVIEPALAHLKRSAVEVDGGFVWPNELWDGDWVSGFSHGGAGIGWAVKRWANLSGDSESFDLAAGALAVQDGLRIGPFDWREKKPEGRVPEENQTSWCHGSQGVLLSILDEEPLDAGELAHYAEAASTLALSHFSGLCHGAAGEVILLRRLADRAESLGLEAPAILLSTITDLQRRLMATLSREKMVGTDPPDLWSASLMTGRAGVVHALAVSSSSTPRLEPTPLLLELLR